MKFPGQIRVRITPQDGQAPWYATSLKLKATPERTVEHLNKLARQQGINAVYELATEETYWEYRNKAVA